MTVLPILLLLGVLPVLLLLGVLSILLLLLRVLPVLLLLGVLTILLLLWVSVLLLLGVLAILLLRHLWLAILLLRILLLVLRLAVSHLWLLPISILHWRRLILLLLSHYVIGRLWCFCAVVVCRLTVSIHNPRLLILLLGHGLQLSATGAPLRPQMHFTSVFALVLNVEPFVDTVAYAEGRQLDRVLTDQI